MARRVKCQDTQEFSTSDIAFKAEDGKYYSSENAYLKFKNNKIYRQKCIDAMYEVLNYKNGMVLPTIFYKKLSELNGVGYESVYYTFKNQSDSIEWSLRNKDFKSEASKVMYIMAIINNHVMDEYKKLERKQKIEEKQEQQVENVEYIDLELTQSGTKKKGTDISNLFGEEEWM